MKRNVQSPFPMLVAGVLFLLAGLALAGGVSYFAGGQAARIKRLEPLQIADVGPNDRGREVIVEGRISATMPARFRDYVAFVHEKNVSTQLNKEDWDEVERVTPPLVIDLPQGSVHVANDSYDFGVMTPITEGRDKYSGFKANDPVLVLGVIEASEDGVSIAADTLAPGPRAAYLSRLGFFQMVFVIMGSVFALVGLLLVIVGVRAIKQNRPVALPRKRVSARGRV